MRPSLAGAAARGVSPKILSFLNDGDVDALIAFHRETFGDARMEGDDNSGDDADGDDGDDDADGDDEDDAEEDKGKKPDPRIKELADEAKKYRLKNRESRARIAELEKQVAELTKGTKSSEKKDDDKGDAKDDASLKELKRVQSEAEKLAQTNEDLLIRVEFMASDKYAWKNPKTALRLLDRSDVEITDDGEVEGLEEAMDALAKAEPYLLKGKDDDDDASKKRRSGDQSGTGSRKKGNPNREQILRKYPALRR